MDLELNRISKQNATRLSSDHPLYRRAGAVMNRPRIEPDEGPCENAQSILLSQGIPAITLALTYGKNMDRMDAMIEIDPTFKGIAQVPGVMRTMDHGQRREL